MSLYSIYSKEKLNKINQNLHLNSHFVFDLLEEVAEVVGGGGEDHLVRVKRCAPAASQSDIGQIVAAEYLPRQSGVWRKSEKNVIFRFTHNVIQIPWIESNSQISPDIAHSDSDLLAELIAVFAPLEPQLGRGFLHWDWVLGCATIPIHLLSVRVVDS